MHTIQYIAVQGDDVDQAFRRVKHELEAMLGDWPESPTNTWFDWFVTGGGRWTTDPANQYNDEYQGDVVHQSQIAFESYLNKAKEFRQTSLDEYVVEANKVDVAKIINDVSVSSGNDFRSGMELYPIKKIYDLAMGIWDYNSYFFDIINDTASMKSLQNSIDNGAEDWYLVPVDFHF